VNGTSTPAVMPSEAGCGMRWMGRASFGGKEVDLGKEDFLLCSVVDERWCLWGNREPSATVAPGGRKRDRRNSVDV
jgi:hypothetical protein